jgi:hypothetical protein
MVKPHPTHLSLPDEDVSMPAIEFWLALHVDAALSIDVQLDPLEVKHDGDAKKKSMRY